MYNCGLILADMGMRGVFTAGVLDVLMEHDMAFKTVYGVSTGCVNGMNYISGQKGRSAHVFINNHGSIYNGYYSGNTSAVRELGIMDNVDTYALDGSEFKNSAYMDSPVTLNAVLTDIKTGSAQVLKVTDPDREKPVLDCASSLSPVAILPTTVNGNKYINGLVSDCIPLKTSQRAGNAKNVVVLTQSSQYFDKNGDNYDVAILRYHKYPELKKALKNASAMFEGSVEYLNSEREAGRVFVIAMPADYQLINTESDRQRLWEAYCCGRQAAEDNLLQLMEFLSDC